MNQKELDLAMWEDHFLTMKLMQILEDKRERIIRPLLDGSLLTLPLEAAAATGELKLIDEILDTPLFFEINTKQEDYSND